MSTAAVQQEILAVIQQGLYKSNLTKLIELCRQCFDDKPALYGSLLLIFDALEREYWDDQAIPSERFAEIQTTLEQPLLSVVTAVDQPGDVMMQHLDALHRAFAQL